MRWLVIGLLVSVGTLLLVAGGVARHVRRQRRAMAEEAVEQNTRNQELDRALDFPKPTDSNNDPIERTAG